MAQTFYCRLESLPRVVHKPADYLAAWTNKDTSHGGGNAALLDSVAGSVQASVEKADWPAIANLGSAVEGMAQFLSPPLLPQTIAAANWTVGWAVKQATAGASKTWDGRIALYLCSGADGSAKTTIFALASIGAAARTAATQKTIFTATLAGAQAIAVAGDYLALELGLGCADGGAGGYTPDTFLYSSGTTAIAADDAASADARSFLTAPVDLPLQPMGGGTPTKTMMNI